MKLQRTRKPVGAFIGILVMVLSPAAYARPADHLPDSVGPLEASGANETRDLPESWDWRELGGMTPVRHQGACNSGWAFAATGALESLYLIRTGTMESFSEQQCLSCNEYGSDCDDGTFVSAYDLWTWFGAVTDSCMPYVGSPDFPCIQSECAVPARINGYAPVLATAEALKAAIMVHPIAVTMHISAMFDYYSGGCFTGPPGVPNHAVLACGWDNDACDGDGAWLVKNSFGPGWGEEGYAWLRFGSCSFGGEGAILELELPPPALVAYAAHEFPDGDHALSPGETCALLVKVTNYAAGEATGVTAVLRSNTAAVTVLESLAALPDLGSWESAVCASAFVVHANYDIFPGQLIEFELEARSDQGTDVSGFYAFVLPVETIYQTDFEDSPPGWSHSGHVDDWELGPPRSFDNQWDPLQAFSGCQLYGTDLNAPPPWSNDGLYEASSFCRLSSPPIDCSCSYGVHLLFHRWLCIEEGVWDRARIKVNDHVIWTNPSAERHLDRVWVPVIMDISDWADGVSEVEIEFELETDDFWRYGGWNIDDFRIVAAPCLAAAPTPFLSGEQWVLDAPPTLSSTGAELVLDVPGGSRSGRVDIFDVSGRAVTALLRGPIGPGRHRLRWDGAYPSGVYFCRAQVGAQVAVARLVLIRTRYTQ